MAVNLGARPEPILRPRQRLVEIEHAGRARGSRRPKPNPSRTALLLLPAALGALLILLPPTEAPHRVPTTTGAAARELHQVSQGAAALDAKTAEPAAIDARPALPATIEETPSRQALDPSRAHDQVWIVARGETLWRIAREIAPDRDPRSVVEALRQVNRLESAALRVGQVLQIPPELYTR